MYICAQVLPDADELSGWTLLCQYALRLPNIKLPELEMGSCHLAAGALASCLARGRAERDAFCLSGGLDWLIPFMNSSHKHVQTNGLTIYCMLAAHKMGSGSKTDPHQTQDFREQEEELKNPETLPLDHPAHAVALRVQVQPKTLERSSCCCTASPGTA